MPLFDKANSGLMTDGGLQTKKKKKMALIQTIKELLISTIVTIFLVAGTKYSTKTTPKRKNLSWLTV